MTWGEQLEKYRSKPYEGRYGKQMDYNAKKMFPSISKHIEDRDPEISWVLDANNNIHQYLGNKYMGAFRVATDEEVSRLSKNGITIHESKKPCPFIEPGQYIIRI